MGSEVGWADEPRRPDGMRSTGRLRA